MTDYVAYVTRVVDGDTFDTSTERVRLANVNAPESGTPEGQSAAAYLKHLIEGQQVTIRPVAKDPYQRTVARVWRYSDSLDINQAMIDSGHATPA